MVQRIEGLWIITQDSGEDLFVHHTSINSEGFRTLEEGQKVEFTVGSGPKGPVAEDVTAA